jgi:hypothetical protein
MATLLAFGALALIVRGGGAAGPPDFVYDEAWATTCGDSATCSSQYFDFNPYLAPSLPLGAIKVDSNGLVLQRDVGEALAFVFGVDKISNPSAPQIGHFRIDALLASPVDASTFDVGLVLGDNRVSFRPGTSTGEFKCIGACDGQLSNPVNMGWSPQLNLFHNWRIDVWPDTATIAIAITDAETTSSVFRVNITDSAVRDDISGFFAGPLVDVPGGSSTGLTHCKQIKFSAFQRASAATTARPTTTGIAVTTAVTTTGIVGSTTNQALPTTGARSSATTGPIAATSAVATTGTPPTTTGSALSTTGINPPPNKAESSSAGANDGSGVVLVIIIVAVIVVALVLCAAVGVVLARRRRGALRQSVSDGRSDSASTAQDVSSAKQHYAKTPESVKGASPYAKTPAGSGDPNPTYARTPAGSRDSPYNTIEPGSSDAAYNTFDGSVPESRGDAYQTFDGSVPESSGGAYQTFDGESRNENYQTFEGDNEE